MQKVSESDIGITKVVNPVFVINEVPVVVEDAVQEHVSDVTVVDGVVVDPNPIVVVDQIAI